MAQDTIKCYDTPSDVVAALAEDFIAFTNEEISRTEHALQVSLEAQLSMVCQRH